MSDMTVANEKARGVGRAPETRHLETTRVAVTWNETDFLCFAHPGLGSSHLRRVRQRLPLQLRLPGLYF
jgi:hypothetical protein